MKLYHSAALMLAMLIVVMSFAASVDAASASFFLSASSSEATVGNTFVVTAALNTGGQTINAASISLAFDKSKLTVAGVSQSSSIFSLWAEAPNFSNEEGRVSGSGGRPTPGYTGTNGTIIKITFRALAEGDANIHYANADMLLNDGLGTKLPASLGALVVHIVKPAPTPTPTPAPTPTPVPPTPSGVTGAPAVRVLNQIDETTWLTDRRPTVLWNLPSDATGASIIIDDQATTDPGKTSIGVVNFYASPVPLDDGVWYAHVRLENKNGWGPATHHLFKVDDTPPTISAARIVSKGNGLEAVNFTASDVSSSVARVSLVLDGSALSSQASSPFALPLLSTGDHTVDLTAYDNAGNHATTQLFVSVVTVSSPFSVLAHLLPIILTIINAILLVMMIFFELRHRRLHTDLNDSTSGFAVKKFFGRNHKR